MSWQIALDTNIVIALLGSDENVIVRLESQPPGSVVLPSIVLHELYFGAFKGSPERLSDNLAKIQHLRFPVLDFSLADAEAAGRIRADLARKGAPIGPYDALSAAQALVRGLVLVTRNLREFERIAGLRIADWL